MMFYFILTITCLFEFNPNIKHFLFQLLYIKRQQSDIQFTVFCRLAYSGKWKCKHVYLSCIFMEMKKERLILNLYI